VVRERPYMAVFDLVGTGGGVDERGLVDASLRALARHGGKIAPRAVEPVLMRHVIGGPFPSSAIARNRGISPSSGTARCLARLSYWAA
jgi:hypothetical protein